jgi:hypothetical protein
LNFYLELFIKYLLLFFRLSHKNKSTYNSSKRSITELTNVVNVVFSIQICHLSDNLLRKGLKDDEGRLRGIPFIIFYITKDYCSNPYFDENDYVFDFILWLFPHAGIELEHLPIFWLNKYKVKFQPSQGSVFLFNTTSTVHCTISTREAGVIGIFIAQKTPYTIRLRAIIDNLTTKVGKTFLKAKDNYESEKVIF